MCVCVHIVLHSEGWCTIGRVYWMPGSSCKSWWISKQQCVFNRGWGRGGESCLFLVLEGGVVTVLHVMWESTIQFLYTSGRKIIRFSMTIKYAAKTGTSHKLDNIGKVISRFYCENALRIFCAVGLKTPPTPSSFSNRWKKIKKKSRIWAEPWSQLTLQKQNPRAPTKHLH